MLRSSGSIARVPAGALVAAFLAAAGVLAACDRDPQQTGGTSAGIRVSVSSLATRENGPNGAIEVTLATAPASAVDVSLVSSDASEGKLIRAGLASADSSVTITFGPADWNVPQVVEVVPQDDLEQDGNRNYTITAGVLATTDPAYLGVPGVAISVTNADDDAPGFTLSKTTATTSERATKDYFTVKLNYPPTAPVTIPVTVGDTSEGFVQGGDSPATPHSTITLTFTTSDWSSAQAVTVIGRGDNVVDGDQTYAVTVGPPGGAAEYLALAAQTVSVTNVDDDVAEVTIIASASPLLTSETGTSATFVVRLATAPTASVTVPVTSGRPDEGLLSSGTQLGVPTLDLTFTPYNWYQWQTVTVTGQDDAPAPISGDNARYDVVIGPALGDPTYAALAPQAVPVLNMDNDAPAVVVPAIGGPPLQTRETGTTAAFTVVLNVAPAAPVTVRVTSNDTTEGLVRTALTAAAAYVDLVFTPTAYLTPQTIIVGGQADSLIDGDQAYTVTVGRPTGDASYAAVAPQDMHLVNIDTNLPGFHVTTGTLALTEGGPAKSFAVALDAPPAAEVVIPVSSGNPAEGLVATAEGGPFVPSLSLTFDASSWSTPQTVWAEGVLDWVDDDAQTFAITIGPTSSTSVVFDGIPSKQIVVTTADVDTAGFTVDAPATLVISEAGATDSFTVRLASKPAATVTIPVATTTDVLLSAGGPPYDMLELQFDATNWDVPQTVTVSALQDTLVENTRAFGVTVGRTTSSDPKYDGLAAQTIAGTNFDDDVGVSEGTTASPIVLTSGFQRWSQVGPGSPSYYSVSLTPGVKFGVLLLNPSADVTVTADDDGDFATGNLCTVTVAANGRQFCNGYVPAGGKVFIGVSTSSATGAGYVVRAAAYQTFISTDVPKPITDGGLYATVSSLTVSGAPASITNVTVKLSIEHTRDADLVIVLRSPKGTDVYLTYGEGGEGDGFTGTIFDDSGATRISGGTAPYTGTFKPGQQLSQLAGEYANGTWLLLVQDMYSVNTGSITAWSLDVM